MNSIIICKILLQRNYSKYKRWEFQWTNCWITNKGENDGYFWVFLFFYISWVYYGHYTFI